MEFPIFMFARYLPDRDIGYLYDLNHERTMQYLETLLADNTVIKIWKHRRSFNSPINLFKRDGTHLNGCGTKKFYELLKRAIILVVEEIGI